MKHYDFDEIIDRRGTNCVKYDGLGEAYPGKGDLVPLWVADMDFATPDFIIDALKKRCGHPVFGYTFDDDEYYACILAWLLQRYDWNAERKWISYIPGVVKGIGFAIQCFTRPGDKIIIQPPVYHPFRLVPSRLGREVVCNPLRLENGMYKMDLTQLENLIDKDCKMLILSNPHNPGGIVWERDALVELARICASHGIVVVSDEIHAEMTYPQFRHHPFPTVSEEASACGMTFMAPSKTFNIAGIVSSYAVIPDSRIREKFYAFLEAGEWNAGTIFAFAATKAAYAKGAGWLRQMLSYVMENMGFVDEYLQKNIPRIKVYRPQASFLVWLDCREMGLPQTELVRLFEDKAGLALNDGTMFGEEGVGFMRLNIGCPRLILEKALDSLKKVVG